MWEYGRPTPYLTATLADQKYESIDEEDDDICYFGNSRIDHKAVLSMGRGVAPDLHFW